VTWQYTTVMKERAEFVALAQQSQHDMSQLCARFGVSRKTGYKWLQRFKAEGLEGLKDRSRQPKTSPKQTNKAMEEQIVAVRTAHPAWGARKIKAFLALPDSPSISTITQVLHRHQCISAAESSKHTAWTRFEHEAPNQLWQMDFKGHFPLLNQQRCHPLTVLDDHSRFSLCLAACLNEQGQTVKECLTTTFRRYGLPERMTMDNGSPWGSDATNQATTLTVWLYRIGIRVSHSRPYHPQTQGKDERFHRTLKAEVLQGQPFRTIATCQEAFDNWRTLYNCQRPHQALAMQVPASRYQPSPRTFPEVLPALEYGPDDVVRQVKQGGRISFKNKEVKVGKAFVGQAVALRPTADDGVYHVYFSKQKISQLNLMEV
jgi:transposase InsO family protein